ncbi:DinB family protein [Paenibacillus sp. SI8]|uniref:DinB family protein n=1 Tax=unclassified Paenibacillus TaxID=185978 RepID=UPI003466C666
MSVSKSIVENYGAITIWAIRLAELQDSTWFKPIAEGKASTADIISHLKNWDQYLITNVIPSVRSGNGVEFPDFDPFNAAAYAYARSGVTQNELLNEFCATRKALCKLLLELGDEVLKRHVTANGVKLCPHTGAPYTLLSIIQEFTDHDNYHKGQIEQALSEV